MIMPDHKKMLDELLSSKNGIEVHSIHFISGELLGREEDEILSSIGLNSYEPIKFLVKGLSYPERKGSQPLPNARAATICIRNKSVINQVILLKDEINPPMDNQDDWKAMVQLCTLLHELGHVEDMQKSINYSFTGIPTVKLLESEAYAHSYALNNLNRLGATIARNTLADALCKLNQSKRYFDKNLYKLICETIGKGRLKRWIKA